MDAGHIIMSKYDFAQMEEVTIKNTESLNSKGFITFLIPFIFY